jgi:hypothetical protein
VPNVGLQMSIIVENNVGRQMSIQM